MRKILMAGSVCVFLLAGVVFAGDAERKVLPLQTLVDDVRAGRVASVRFERYGRWIEVATEREGVAETYLSQIDAIGAVDRPVLSAFLSDHGVAYEIGDVQGPGETGSGVSGYAFLEILFVSVPVVALLTLVLTVALYVRVGRLRRALAPTPPAV